MTLLIAPLFTAGITIGSLQQAFGGLQIELSIEKTCEELVPIEPGTIQWTIRVENLGDEINELIVRDQTLSELADLPDPLGIEPNFGENDEFDLEILVDNLPAGIYSNTLTVTVTDEQGDDIIFEVVAECEILPSSSIQVDIDIKPQSCPNPINTNSKGVLPVAILGTGELDVNDIDVSTIRLVGASPIRDNIEDVGTPLENNNNEQDPDPLHCTTEGADGFDDLTLKFRTQDVIAGIGTCNTGNVKQLNLVGNLNDGTAIMGHDVVIIIDDFGTCP